MIIPCLTPQTIFRLIKAARYMSIVFLFGFATLVINAATYFENNGMLCIEAENYEFVSSSLGRKWSAKKETEASNGIAMVLVAIGDGSAPLNDGSALVYQLNISSPGNYYINVRACGSDRSKNTVYVILNGCGIKTLPLSNGPYSWNQVGPFSLSEGVYTLNISSCENGVIVDKLVVNKDPTLPFGLGPSARPKSHAPFAGLMASILSEGNAHLYVIR
jgi:hypothetical protein